MRPIEKLIEKRKEEFIRNNLMSDEFIDFIQQNKKPMDKLLSYYACAIMEVETKFRVLDHQYSLEYDRNPIEDIKSRVKSWESLIKKVRRKEIPLTLSSIEENIHDIAGVRVVCSFPDDIYMLADCLLNQDDITPVSYTPLVVISFIPVIAIDANTEIVAPPSTCLLYTSNHKSSLDYKSLVSLFPHKGFAGSGSVSYTHLAACLAASSCCLFSSSSAALRSASSIC